jgi:uncharacterized phage-associated protein
VASKIIDVYDKEKKQRKGENMAVQFEFDYEKTVAASVYIVSKNLPELTMGKLFKLLYLSDKDHLVRFGRPITGDNYAAMKDGPVPSHLYDLFKELRGTPSSPPAVLLAKNIKAEESVYQYPRLVATGPIDPMQLSVSDIASLDRILFEYGQFSFLRLRALTHETPAWENAWSERTSDSSPMKFEDFFEEDPDALVGAKEEMLENFVLKAVFNEPTIF